jgi:uncharacterized protein YjbI with pentapeptide repeats
MEDAALAGKQALFMTFPGHSVSGSVHQDSTRLMFVSLLGGCVPFYSCREAHGPPTLNHALKALFKELRPTLEQEQAVRSLAAWLVCAMHRWPAFAVVDQAGPRQIFSLHRPLAELELDFHQLSRATAAIFGWPVPAPGDIQDDMPDETRAGHSYSDQNKYRHDDKDNALKLARRLLNLSCQGGSAYWRELKEQKHEMTALNVHAAPRDWPVAALHAALRTVYLVGADLSGREHLWGILESADLAGAYLPRANLAGAQMKNVRMQGADLSGVNLRGALLSGGQFAGACLVGANLECVKAIRADFHGARLDYAGLAGANLARSRLESANLDHACLNGASVCRASLTGASLRHAALRRLKCRGANFHRARLDGVDFTLSASECRALGNPATGALMINHLDDDCRSLLHTLDGIDDRYHPCKHRLIGTLLAGLAKHLPVRDSVPALADRLLRNDGYVANGPIRDFIATHMLPELLASWSQRLLRRDEVDERVVLQLLKHTPECQWLVPRYHGAVNQLLCAARARAATRSDPAAAPGSGGECGTVDQPPAGPEVAASGRVEEVHRMLVGSAELREAAAALDAIEPGVAESLYWFANPDGLGATACEPHMFTALMDCRAETRGIKAGSLERVPWHAVWSMARDSRNQPYENRTVKDDVALFRPFPLLDNARMSAVAQQLSGRLFDATFDCNSHFTSSFVAALSRRIQSRDGKDWLGARENELEQALRPLREPLYETPRPPPDVRATAAHVDGLWQTIMRDSPISDTQANRARLLLVLAAIFTRLTSSAAFGTEAASPESLRWHALALLNRAALDDPALVGHDRLADWRARLTGQAFSCTAILSGLMVQHICESEEHDAVSGHLFRVMYPMAWR